MASIWLALLAVGGMASVSGQAYTASTPIAHVRDDAVFGEKNEDDRHHRQDARDHDKQGIPFGPARSALGLVAPHLALAHLNGGPELFEVDLGANIRKRYLLTLRAPRVPLAAQCRREVHRALVACARLHVSRTLDDGAEVCGDRRLVCQRIMVGVLVRHDAGQQVAEHTPN